MNKTVIGVIVVVMIAAVAVFAIGSVVYAQTPTPGPQNAYGFGPGRGGRMGAGMMARQGGQIGQTGQAAPIHDEMVAAMADKLGLSSEELDTRLDGGETMMQIAAEKGWTIQQFFTTMGEARTTAVDKALAAGKITQEQADWLKQMQPGQMGRRGGGRMGGGQWNGGCPCLTQPTQQPAQ